MNKSPPMKIKLRAQNHSKSGKSQNLTEKVTIVVSKIYIKKWNIKLEHSLETLKHQIILSNRIRNSLMGLKNRGI